MAVAAAFCIWLARRQPGRPTVFVERVLALVILAAWAGEYIYDGVLGTWKVDEDLPLQLTDAVSIVSVVALWTRRPRLVELCYLLGMTAALQAVLTPDLQQSFPSPYYFTYFIYHCGAVVAACLLVFGERHPLRPGAARRVYLTTLAWMGIAELANLTLAGANYMYLRVVPGTPRC